MRLWIPAEFPFMRILKTTQTYYPHLSKGGPPVKVRAIAGALVRRGHEVTVLTADLGEPAGTFDVGNWKRERNAWGWELRVLQLRRFHASASAGRPPSLLRFVHPRPV